MIQIKNKIDCCGCNACGDVCAHGAITFRTDMEGFWYPEVDAPKCKDCGLCEKVCPMLHVDELKKNDYEKPICYAAIHKNLEVRFDSTSGGLFSAFAEKIYQDHGYVGGAIYNDDFSVRQYISADKTDLPKLRSSKYQQSNFEGFYKQVRSLLKQGEKVLVCGGPCQMTALRALLGKDYENLFILDYVCRGINSPLVSGKFREALEAKHNSKVVYQKAKNKELGWTRLTVKYVFANGEIEYLTRDNNLMTRGFLQTGAYSRPCCYDCKFKGLPRIADITLADFWGLENISDFAKDNLGTSLVLINSEKGKALFEQISGKIQCKELPFETAVPGNPAIFKSMESKFNEGERKQFFEDVNSMKFMDVAEKYFAFPPASKLSWKKLIKRHLRLLKKNAKEFEYKLIPLWQYIKYNYLTKEIHSDVPNNGYVLPRSHTAIDIQPGAEITLNAPLKLGWKKVRGSKLETRFLVGKGGRVIIDNVFGVSYGADIEVFSGATLHIHGSNGIQNVSSGANVGFTLICGDRIDIGYDVKIGRNVTIRDNNGGHYLNMQGYRTSKPVKIGNHVWLCESCTILQGVKIGDGAVVAAHSVVISNVPANCLVAGNPARIVERDINWKY